MGGSGGCWRCWKNAATLVSLLAMAMLLGLLFVLAMTRVYQIDTVPTWYNGYTTSAFFRRCPRRACLPPCCCGWRSRLQRLVFATERGRAGHQRRSYHYAKRRLSYLTAAQQADPAARLWQTPGATPGTAGAGPRLLAMSADPPPAAARYGAANRPAAGLDRRMYWPRPVLWSAYHRRYRRCRLIDGAGAPQKE